MPELEKYLRWLSTFEFHGIKPGLLRIQRLLKKLGNPHHSYPTLHIAGTNGKGSTSAMLESIFSQLGLKVGLYTSPHLFHLKERVRVGKKVIDEETLTLALKIIRKTLGPDEATYFELTTALAFLIFAEKKVDLAVIECGLGGRLDATNMIRPEVSVVTSVGLDHTRYLGDTLSQIAYEKAGIIKRGQPVVIGRMPSVASKVIVERAKKLNSPYSLWGMDFETVPAENAWTYFGDSTLSNLELNLKGHYQGYNLGCALRTVELVKGTGLFTWDEPKLREALLKVDWPGRYQRIELLGKNFLFDSAHNPPGAEALRESLLKEKKNQNQLLILGATNEEGTKPFEKIYDLLEDLFQEVYICEFSSPRKIVTISEWRSKLAQQEKVSYFYNTTQALKKALEGPYREIVVSGSIYFVADFLKTMKAMKYV